MSYVKGSQLPSTSTVADTDTLIVTKEGDSKATKKVAKSDLLKEDRTRLTNLETDNTTNKSNITNLQQENQTLKNNVKALEYVINNSNRLNYTGEIITNSNSAVGDIRNIIVNGNTRYKKSDKTYTDTWESGVSLESVGEAEKNSDGKYPIEVFSCNGENLMRGTVFEKSHADYTLEDGRYTVSGDSTFNWAHVSFVIDNLVVGAEYVCSCFIESSGNKSGIVQLADGNNKTLIFTRYATGNVGESFIATSPTMYLRLFANNDEYSGVKRYSNVIVSKKHNKRTILLDSPLRKVGTIADVLDLEKMKVVRKCKTITIDGSSDENWGIDLPKTDIILFYCKNIITENAPKNYDIHLISDKFSSFRYDNMWDNTNEGISVSNNILRINISKSKLETQDVAGFKKWLQSNPVTVVYQLATPTTEDIQVSPTDNPLTSYTPSTTLTTNNTIKGNISADMPTNLSGVITQQASLIAQLEDNLLQTQALLIDNVIDNT